MFTGVEFLILSLCLSGYDCTNGPKAYYAMPGVKNLVTNTKKEVVRQVGKDAIQAATIVAPFIAAGLGNTASFKISKNWSIEGNSKESRIVVQWNY